MSGQIRVQCSVLSTENYLFLLYDYFDTTEYRLSGYTITHYKDNIHQSASHALQDYLVFIFICKEAWGALGFWPGDMGHMASAGWESLNFHFHLIQASQGAPELGQTSVGDIRSLSPLSPRACQRVAARSQSGVAVRILSCFPSHLTLRVSPPTAKVGPGIFTA